MDDQRGLFDATWDHLNKLGLVGPVGGDQYSIMLEQWDSKAWERNAAYWLLSNVPRPQVATPAKGVTK